MFTQNELLRVQISFDGFFGDFEAYTEKLVSMYVI